MRRDRYFDNAATTPVDPRVLEAMLPFFEDEFGNANSVHSAGAAAQAAVDQAREHVAALIGAEAPDEIVFTSGASEANNWMVRAFPGIAISPFEHSSLLEPVKRLLGADDGVPPAHFRSGRDARAPRACILSNEGFQVTPPDGAQTVSLMMVNNEIGTIFKPEKLNGPWLKHSDITQAVGKIPVEVTDLDFASFSGHKFYGPKGVGALYAKNANFPEALISGGEQELGFRSGTLNVPGIVGMGKAAEIALDEWEEDYARAKELREILVESLNKSLDFRVNGGAEVSPYVLSLSFYGIEGETLVIEMDRLGFAISSGAACSSHSAEPNHVLTALGVEPEWLRGTIRVSFGRFNSKGETERLTRGLSSSVETLTSLNV